MSATIKIISGLLLFSPVLAADEPRKENAKPATRNISIVFEAISLPLAEAAGMIREGQTDDGLYESCVRKITSKEARQECLTVVRSVDDYSARSEAVLETTYPTEYEPPETPNHVAVDQPFDEKPVPPATIDLDRLVSPATPTAFETRNLGVSIESSAEILSDPTLIALRITPEWVRLIGQSTHGQGKSTTPMPEIEKQGMHTSVTLRPGKPFLLGTFNRTPESKVAPEQAERVWFAFVTARVVEP